MRKSVATHTFTFIVSVVSARFTWSRWLCEKAPSVLRTSAVLPAVPLCGDGNGTLNQCLAASGFITRWRPIVAALRWQQVAAEQGHVWRKWGRWFGEIDNGAISQRILPPVGWRRRQWGSLHACWDKCSGWASLSLTASSSPLIEMSRQPPLSALRRHCQASLDFSGALNCVADVNIKAGKVGWMNLMLR